MILPQKLPESKSDFLKFLTQIILKTSGGFVKMSYIKFLASNLRTLTPSLRFKGFTS